MLHFPLKPFIYFRLEKEVRFSTFIMREVSVVYPIIDSSSGDEAGEVFAELVDIHPVTMEAAGSVGPDKGAEAVKALQKL